MKEVKKEKFGSRKSVIKKILIENNIDFISGIWIITCRYRINSDRNTRYLVCIEEKNRSLKYESLLKKINADIPVLRVNFKENEKTVEVENLRTLMAKTLSYQIFKKRIIERTCCRYLSSHASGSKNSTPLSRFFRENMGKGFALTDIDFYLTEKQIFIEEKNFIQHGKGFIGVGQCLSFREIIRDIFNKSELKIICTHNDSFFTSAQKNIDCTRKKTIPGWGEMVVFDLNHTSINALIDYLKN